MKNYAGSKKNKVFIPIANRRSTSNPVQSQGKSDACAIATKLLATAKGLANKLQLTY